MSSMETAPKDRFNLIYLLIFFLGISGHLPWNAVLTAQPFFTVKLSKSTIGIEFTAHFAIIFKAMKFFIFALVSLTGLKINSKLWVGLSAVGNVVLFALFSSMTDRNSSIAPNVFYLITLTMVIAAGLFLALFECGMYSILGTFPGRLMQSFLAGNAIGGILAAANLIISFYTADSDIYQSTRLYFMASTVVFAMALAFFIGFLFTDYFRFYQRRLALYTAVSQVSQPTTNAGLKASDSQILSGSFDELNPMKSEESSTLKFPLKKKPSQSLAFISSFSTNFPLVQKLRSPACSLFLMGFVNLAIFPALVSITESTRARSIHAGPFQRELFIPLAFLVVSAADFLGKMLPSWKPFYRENFPFLTLSISRLVFIPLFLLGNIRMHGAELVIPALLASDSLFFLLIVLAFTSAAYLGTMLLVSAPKQLDVTQQSTGTVLLCAALQLGVFGGAIFSLILKLALRLFIK